MSSLVGDLWPTDLVRRLQASPQSIMKQQAARLGGKTNDLVLADVRPKVTGGNVFLSFDLVVPLLENYRYPLILAIHPLDKVFPVVLRVEGQPDQNIAGEAEFVEKLREALNSERVKNVIRTFVDMQAPDVDHLEFEN